MRVPSQICYNSKGEVHGWGYGIRDSDERLAWFKLLLDPARYSTAQYLMLSRTMNLIPRTKKPVDVVADYLSCLRKHTIQSLQKIYGDVNMTPISYVLAVPAVRALYQGSTCTFELGLLTSLSQIWSDAAKALTLQAAETAGFGSKDMIELVSEPDAAAAWPRLKDIQHVFFKVRF